MPEKKKIVEDNAFEKSLCSGTSPPETYKNTNLQGKYKSGA
jgi:hypothetical protein